MTLDYSGPAAAAFTLANPFPAVPTVGQFAQRWANLTTGANSALNAPFLDAATHTPTVRQYNMTFQYEFAPRWVLEAGYVGSNGINLTDYNHDAYNTSFLASPTAPINGITTNTTANAALRVPYLGWQPTGLQGTAYDLTESYNSLQVTVRKQFSHGFTMQGAYTWSKSLTNSLQNTANSGDPRNLDQQYGPSYFNRPQRFVINYGWDLPFGQHSGATGKLLNGWNISGVTTIQDGDAVTIIDTRGGSAYGIGTGGTTQSGFSRAQLCPGMTYGDIYSQGGIGQRLGGPGQTGYFNSAAFCTPPAVPFNGGDASSLGWGNTGPGIAMGPGQFNFDLTVLKTTPITERVTLQFRAEFFNLFNHPQFLDPNGALSVPIAPALPTVTASNFGWITSTSVEPRVVQLGLKLILRPRAYTIWRGSMYEFFAQDSWKVNSKLHIDYGVRTHHHRRIPPALGQRRLL